VSVTVGFSQATTSLIVPAPGATKPDGTPADGSAEAGGDAGLFAALLAMLTPGAQPAAAEATTAVTADTPAVAALNTILPPADEAPAPIAPETPVLLDLADLPESFEGKALLRDFTDALKAAKTALDEGKPLDLALEKKLKETVDAIAAWFAGQPQLQPASVDLSKLGELAAGTSILPASPSGDSPEAPVLSPVEGEPVAAPTDTPEVPAPNTASTGTVVEKMVQAQPVPAQLAELGDALKDFAAQLDKVSPDLAKALGKLADRLSTGDIADDVMAQLGLTRSLGSTSPELDQFVAALTAKPDTKTTVAAPAPSIAAPVLDMPEVLAGQAAASVSPEVKAEARKAEVPQPETTRPEAKAEKKAEPVTRSADLELDTDVTLDARATRTKDDPAAEARPATPVAASQKPDTPSPAAAQAPATGADTSAQAAAAASAATATRAIHAAYAAPVQQLNVPQVAFEVVRQFEAGNTRFQIRLDPADLGRIDVKLDLEKNGTVNARMFVERPETLDLMMRDQRALQQALQQAGLDTSKTNLEFSLRQNPFAGSGGDMGQGSGNGNGQPGFGPYGIPAADESTELAAQTLYRGSASASGVNLFV
jgi:flagellar hook-length control protein FliK